MSQTPEPNKKPRSAAYIMGFVPLAVGGEVGCMTILIVGIALVAGIWIDKTFGTKPAFTLILLLGSAPLSLYVTFRVATREVKRMIASQPPADEAVKHDQEDDDRE